MTAPAVRVNALDRAIAWFSPAAALARLQTREVLAYYEAAKPNRQRRQRQAPGTGNTAVRAAGSHLRQQARHLEQNDPKARGLLRILTNNVVGPNGIGVEPQPKRPDGSVHEQFAALLSTRYERWSKRPEVTRQMDRAECERLLWRSVVRDGEALNRLIEGTGPQYQHATDTPLSIQLLECDHLPLGYDGTNQVPGDGTRPPTNFAIYDAIELNAWGARRAYWMYDQHPGEAITLFTLAQSALRRVPADQVQHLALCDRIGQRRGVSLFASILETLDDLGDYEESERVAAKIAAMLGAAIVKGSPDTFGAPLPGAPINDDDGTSAPRELKFRAGMIFDDLRPGESVQMIGNNGRPNPGMIDFRYAQLRDVCTATGANFSAVSKLYDGSYSAQRQGLTDSWVDYAVLSALLISWHTRPTYERLVALDLQAGNLVLPPDLAPLTVADALFIPPSMPWIDPLKEAMAWERQEQAGHISGPDIIRRRGMNPAAVRNAEIAWRESWRAKGERITADPAASDPAAFAAALALDQSDGTPA